jgi:pyruvate,water dikinase
VDPSRPALISLAAARGVDVGLVGGKAHTLSRLAGAGYPVCPGVVVTTEAYLCFLQASGLEEVLEMEVFRKDMDGMRWEELWDSALRIRTRFLASPLPESLANAILDAWRELPEGPVAVRSSAPAEDGASRSFAGLHESVLDVVDAPSLLDATRVVWASLWSDAALLYCKELGLAPRRSSMAVLIQSMKFDDPSGVAFARDPRDLTRPVALIEAVPGICQGLVDGEVDPDRWEVDRTSRKVRSWRAGRRDPVQGSPYRRNSGHEELAVEPLLEADEVSRLTGALLAVEETLGFPPDVEWTGRDEGWTLLQARPITAPVTADPNAEDRRGWYLGLRPGDARLRRLRQLVAEELIPALEREGNALAEESLEELADQELAEAIEARRARLAHWMKVYWEEFIPFAHGVRRLGTFYNDLVRPADPYEFVALLRSQPLLATRRNGRLDDLARRLQRSMDLARALDDLLQRAGAAASSEDLHDTLRDIDGGTAFVDGFEELCASDLDVTYGGRPLREDTSGLLAHLLERAGGDVAAGPKPPQGLAELERQFLAKVGKEQQEEAREVLETARVSWRLRDDDNLLVGRIESQLVRALQAAADRLHALGRLQGERLAEIRDLDALVQALRDPSAGPVELEAGESAKQAGSAAQGTGTPRQLLGQPASPGLARGSVRRVLGPRDLSRFRRGDVLVCDAIEPAMTLVVPLAAAVIERRGGMLIHGAIIARELGIPCVNGVESATTRLTDGLHVTVDGYLGVVTVGPPSFDLELRGALDENEGER